MVQGESFAGVVWQKDANAVILRVGLIISRIFQNQYLVNLVLRCPFICFGADTVLRKPYFGTLFMSFLKWYTHQDGGKTKASENFTFLSINNHLIIGFVPVYFSFY
jgi:hypothetical protein